MFLVAISRTSPHVSWIFEASNLIPMKIFQKIRRLCLSSIKMNCADLNSHPSDVQALSVLTASRVLFLTLVKFYNCKCVSEQSSLEYKCYERSVLNAYDQALIIWYDETNVDKHKLHICLCEVKIVIVLFSKLIYGRLYYLQHQNGRSVLNSLEYTVKHIFYRLSSYQQ